MSQPPSVYDRRRDMPSVIARLMGIPPVPLKAAEQTTNLKSPPTITSTRSAPFNQAKCSLLSTADSRRCLKKTRVLSRRPRSRQRHPQEDLLQKIREDFQSWQASKAPLEFGDKHLDGRCIQMIAQENLRKEKMARYGYGYNTVAQTSDSENATKVGADEEKTIRVVSHCAAKDGHNQSTTEKLSSPARIVLLKPSSDHGELLFGLSSRVKRDDNMEEFLQEVKQRLQKELKVKSASELRGTEPNHVAITEIKQTATTKRLSRSEAFRSTDRKRNHAIIITDAKQEYVKINTRNILVHRPKNVTPRTETVSPKKGDEESVDSFPFRSRGRVRSLTGAGFDEQTCTSSECLIENGVSSVGTEILPQRKLVRSFSAPESGIFRINRLLVLDEGGNHRASETRSSSFSFRETVSSLRHRFSFRGKLLLLGRKKQPSFQDQEQLAISRSPSPSESFRLVCNFPQANFTELLPPSPASPLEIVGHSSRHFFSSLPELTPICHWELEAPAASELSFKTDITVETTCNLDKAYIREVLVAAGLYDDGSLDNKARPICDYIFDEVEDIYYYYYCDKSADHDNSGGRNATDHRMLFDLANEALQMLVHGTKTGSSLGQWVVDSTGVSRGRKLVDDVWQEVQALRKPQMQEIDSMVAFDVRKSVWAEVLYEDLYVIGRKIERAIFDDLLLQVFNSLKLSTE